MSQREEMERIDQQIREVSRLVQGTLTNIVAVELKGGEGTQAAARGGCFGTFGTWGGCFGTFGCWGGADSPSAGTRS